MVCLFNLRVHLRTPFASDSESNESTKNDQPSEVWTRRGCQTGVGHPEEDDQEALQ